jgi:hypothetical protein
MLWRGATISRFGGHTLGTHHLGIRTFLAGLNASKQKVRSEPGTTNAASEPRIEERLAVQLTGRLERRSVEPGTCQG